MPKLRRPWVPIGVTATDTPIYHPPGPLRRVFAAAASLGIAVVVGAVVAIVASVGAIYAVITLTDLLKQ